MTHRRVLGAASIVVGAAVLIVAGVGRLDGDAGEPSGESPTFDAAATASLPPLCDVFGPLHEFSDSGTYSIAEQVRLGDAGFRGEAGAGRTAVAYLALAFDRDAGPGQPLAEYMVQLRFSRTDRTITPPAPNEDVEAAARIVDDTLRAGGCEGWQEQSAD